MLDAMVRFASIGAMRPLLVAAAFAVLALPAAAQVDERPALNVLARGPLVSLDPVAQPSYATLDHGYMVYDTLFALDDRLKPQPQMVERHAVSADGLLHMLELRADLAWHDGKPVTAEDCIASIRRWAPSDALGRALLARLETMSAVDARVLEIHLTRPFPLLETALARPLGTVPFMLPARLAATPPGSTVEDATGSGPYRYLPEEREGLFRAVYARHEGYRPRPEPLSLFAGGKVAGGERVAFLYIPDLAIATFELYGGTAQYWRTLEADAVPRLATNPDVAQRPLDPFGDTALLRLNHRAAPFDDARLRQAARLAIDQQALVALLGAPVAEARVCATVFPCGLPGASATAAAAQPIEERRISARRLLRESGYDGKPVVLLTARDQAITDALARAVADQLRRVGFTVTLHEMIWPELAQRRQSTAPSDQGGWSAFVTRWPVLDLASPGWNAALRATGAGAWFGWPEDAALEKLRQSWIDAANDDARRGAQAAIEARATEVVPYVPLAQFRVLDAWRATEITPPPPAPVLAVWGIEAKKK